MFLFWFVRFKIWIWCESCFIVVVYGGFGIPRRKSMQNHLEITSKSQLWTRSVRNWTKTLTSVMPGPTLWLHKLRNAQGKIYGTYLGNIYGTYKEYIRNIHKYSWYKIIRNTGTAFGGAPMGRPPSAAAPLGLCFWLSYIINIYGYSLYIPYILHIYMYIFPKYFPYIFPWVFLNLWSQE